MEVLHGTGSTVKHATKAESMWLCRRDEVVLMEEDQRNNMNMHAYEAIK